MTFSRFLLCSLLLCIAAWAEDKPRPQTALSSTELQKSTEGSGNSAQFNIHALTNPFNKPDSNAASPELRDPERPSLAVLNGDVCYTLRTYKVKRTERLKDAENGRRGYTTCEMAAGYQLRSADAKVRDSSPPK